MEVGTERGEDIWFSKYVIEKAATRTLYSKGVLLFTFYVLFHQLFINLGGSKTTARCSFVCKG
jgi:hypothetical protein